MFCFVCRAVQFGQKKQFYIIIIIIKSASEVQKIALMGTPYGAALTTKHPETLKTLDRCCSRVNEHSTMLHSEAHMYLFD